MWPDCSPAEKAQAGLPNDIPQKMDLPNFIDHTGLGRRSLPSIGNVVDARLLMRYATYSQRARALFIDSIWWTVILLFIPFGPSTEDILMAPETFVSSIILWLMAGQCIPILVTGVMWAVWGTSPGKRAVRLRIVDADTGQPMTVTQAMLRTLGYLFTFATFGAGFLWVLSNPRKQALHDRVANTVVIDIAATVSNLPTKK
ncbi:RDD family protein [Paraburkholderia franconis]|nr:RDD family protein [Paraburkholderia franconis]